MKRIGTSAEVAELLEGGATPPECEIRVVGSDREPYWALTLGRQPTYRWERFDALFNLSISDHAWALKEEFDPVKLLASVAAAVTGPPEFYFGFVDVNAFGSGGGSQYREQRSWPMTFRQEVDHLYWLRKGGARHSSVRDVYWGMILTAEHLARLPADFREAFLQVDTDGERPQSAHALPGGGVFLALSANPLDACVPFPSGYECPAVVNAVWLRQALEAAQLM